MDSRKSGGDRVGRVTTKQRALADARQIAGGLAHDKPWRAPELLERLLHEIGARMRA
ncbi:MAG: hypothetical protein JO046_08430 [Solirubrobacterales bacterium]|nr:hypothetical protein [Solirubrobacterales bacterium]